MMPILIVILIGWFNWLVYLALHCGALQDWCSHYSVTWCVLCFLFANLSSKHSIMSMSIVRQILTSQHSN